MRPNAGSQAPLPAILHPLHPFRSLLLSEQGPSHSPAGLGMNIQHPAINTAKLGCLKHYIFSLSLSFVVFFSQIGFLCIAMAIRELALYPRLARVLGLKDTTTWLLFVSSGRWSLTL